MTADTGTAEAALTGLPQVANQSLTVTADTGTAEAALTGLPQVADQSLTVTADTSLAQGADNPMLPQKRKNCLAGLRVLFKVW